MIETRAAKDVTRSELLRYSLFAAPLAMAALPIYVHVPKLYAEFGLSLGLLGGLLLALRSLDALIDPWLGRWADHMRSRFKACLIASVALLLGMLALLNPAAAPVALWLWLTGSLLLVYFGFSLATIAYGAWGAELPRTPAARTTVTATREAVGLGGVLLAAALPSVLATINADGLSRFAWVFVVALVGAMVCLRPLRDEKVAAASNGPLFAVLRDRRFVLLLAVFAINGIASAIPATLLLFFVDDVLQARDWEPIFLVGYFLAGALAMPVWTALARRYGKQNAWAIGMLTAIVAFCSAATFGAGDRIPFLLVCIASGIALGADLALPPSILADTIDANQKQTLQHGAGSYFGLWALVTKANLALAAGLALPLVGAFGYRVADPTSNVGALTMAYALIPCALKLLALILLLRLRHRI